MKARIYKSCSLAVVLAVIPILSGCDQQEANSAPVSSVAASQPDANALTDTNSTDAAPAGDTNQPAGAAVTDDQLADAPGTVISAPDTGSTNTSTNPQLNDLVKLVQAGMGESVLLAYVTNSATPFNLSSDDILYLNDLGTPETVVTAMLQRDQYFKSMGATAAAAPDTQSAYANTTPAPAENYADQGAVTQPVEAPLTPPPAVVEDAEQSPNVSYSYFYDSLSPYGTWINVDGYGPCWQPTAVVVDPGWQPYCDGGYWAYTDSGWYWDSDYSWGWAPFHYGRWFHHNRWGWCWAPDTVWGPAWVSWRYNDAYCGWAPLPPSACYRPGFGFTYFGRSVGFNFGFGLSANSYLFVSLNHFHDRSPGRHRVPHREIGKIYGATTVHNQMIRGNNNLLINRGVPVERVAAASHTQIRAVHIRMGADGPRSARLGRDGHTLNVYRPNLPAPNHGGNPRFVGEGVQRDPHFDLRARTEARTQRPTVTRPTPGPMTPGRTPIISGGAGMRPVENPARDNRLQQPNQERPGSLILRGPDRGNPGWQRNPVQNQPSNLRHGPEFPPQSSPRPVNPPNNNLRSFTPPQQPVTPAVPPRTLAPPTFNRPGFGRPENVQPGQQQRELQSQPAWPRQENRSGALGTPRMNDQNNDSGFRSEPIRREPIPSQPARSFEQPRNFEQQRSFEQPRNNFEQPRTFEPRSAPEVRSAPAREFNGGGFRGGNPGGGGGGGHWGGGGNANAGGGGGGRNR